MAVTVALLGGPGSGKTTLGLALTHHLNALGISTTLVPEHLQAWREREGRAPRKHEHAWLAQAQSERIRLAANADTRVVVADTTALMVSTWNEVLFRNRSLHPASLKAQEQVRLTLLMGLDFPWPGDCQRPESSTGRKGVDAVLRRELQASGLPFQTVYGKTEARLKHALGAVGSLLSRPLVAHDPLLETGTGRWTCENCSDPACERRLFSGLLSSR